MKHCQSKAQGDQLDFVIKALLPSQGAAHSQIRILCEQALLQRHVLAACAGPAKLQVSHAW